MKDNFSAQAACYAQFRPDYPDALVRAIAGHCQRRDKALDVATGNGQLAILLSRYFAEVYATDISQKQLENAVAAPNVQYSAGRAEQTDFPDHSFDLVTVAQALHWMDFGRFYPEVKRVLKPGGIFAAVGYGLFRATPGIDKVIDDFYRNVTGPYWDPERRWIDEGYRTVPFPFDEIRMPPFSYERNWTFAHALGYLGSWSAVQHYKKANGADPLVLVYEALKNAWGAGTKTVVFPLLLRIGRV